MVFPFQVIPEILCEGAPINPLTTTIPILLVPRLGTVTENVSEAEVVNAKSSSDPMFENAILV